ncbi:hypothetical protein [Actinomadura macrotermitis]|uniref:DUF8129 domain-containing protein n=1 Tax=Actinomadura macrotermitis TaxID=2585200 RepID=A0A7K0BS88_9ACTN|nr:hypothetical protein [Actinomadura macrotermitis]MQY03896.1 hypothetical protein [Actinomadura macrotermitis]
MTRSPRRLKQQVQETVGEQVRDIPLHAVRLAMFGVGRALLLSDRVTKDYKEITEGDGVKPVLGRLACDVQQTAGKVVGRVVTRVRGGEGEAAPVSVPDAPAAPPAPKPAPAPRALGKEISVGKPAAKPAPAEPKPEPEPAAQAEPEPKPETKPEFEPKPELKPAAQAEAAAIAAQLPVPNYDAATLPQLRARLRGLTADQVKLLHEYENKHAARPDVLRMYENRILKLNGQG